LLRIKICGITRLADAVAAAEYGADALGFVFYRKSPRFIEPEYVAEIIGKLPPFVTPVALFVNEDAKKVSEIISITGINVIQFHGDETSEYISGFDQRVIKAVRIEENKPFNSLNSLPELNVNAVLFDAYSKEAYGGTGITFNWGLIKDFSRSSRIILAGGLSPDNVKEAVETVQPYGVDVSSGVESSPGVKDHSKIKQFIVNAGKG